MTVRIAIGIATRGRAAIVAEALTEIRRQTREPDRILVCHVSMDDVSGLFETHPNVEMLMAPAGLPRQRNAIMDSVPDCDWLVFFDDDFLPAPDYLAVLERVAAARPDMVVATGHVIADGAKGPGLTVAEGQALLARDAAPVNRDRTEKAFNGYGCTMAIRLAPVREHGLRFDEALPLYAWYEDIDFTRRLGEHGTILRLRGARGVHLGVKSGRVPGLRLGYSQVVNPIYLARKGSFPWSHAIPSALRHCVINLLRSAWPEAHVDRYGRFRGNMMGVLDLIRGRASPGRILKL